MRAALDQYAHTFDDPAFSRSRNWVSATLPQLPHAAMRRRHLFKLLPIDRMSAWAMRSIREDLAT